VPKGYWIPHIDVSDPEGYKAYMAATPPAHQKYNGVALVRGGKMEVAEGRARARNCCANSPTMPPRSPAAGARKGYWIGHVDVTDPERYQAYMAANAAPFGMFGARFLVRGGAREVVEGRVRSRTVVLEFPSYEAARDCYHSAAYQAAKRLRDHKGELDLVIVEGHDGVPS
jgi:uncharacterized protein (DUF1330 family)